MNDTTRFYLELWSMLPPDQLDRLIKTGDRIRDRRQNRLSDPRPELQSPATQQRRGMYKGPIQ